MPYRITLSFLISFGFLLMTTPVLAQPAEAAEEDDPGPVPPRLSWLDGEVYFERVGSDGIREAVVNLPLAPRDLLRTGPRGSFEIQFGPKAFARGWSSTRLELEQRERERLRFDLQQGDFALDIRRDPLTTALEIRTDGFVAAIHRAGYYRLNTASGKSVIRVHRQGHAVLSLTDGGRVEVSAGEECTVDPERPEAFSLRPAAAEDSWDHWNIARTDYLVQSESERYIPPDLYGTRELDRHGTWSRVPEYGPVWTPHDVPAGWVPYSTGFWILDPDYGWTWVDTQPWGWAPFHYGRWVRVHGRWSWAPGPVIVRPVYAPALVVFTSSSSGSILFSLSGPPQAWVALGWGEPCIPWWGHAAFRRPWWGGWGGPRVVNHVVIHKNTVVHVHHLRSFEHAHIHRAVVKAREDHFPRGHRERDRFAGPGNPALREHARGTSRPPREIGLPQDGSRFATDRRAEGPALKESEIRRPPRSFEPGQEVRTPITEAGRDPLHTSEPAPSRGPAPPSESKTLRTRPEAAPFSGVSPAWNSPPRNRSEARGPTQVFEERKEIRTLITEAGRQPLHPAAPFMRRGSEPRLEVPAARMRNGLRPSPRRSPEVTAPAGSHDPRRYLQRQEGRAVAQAPAASSIGESRRVEPRPPGPVRTPFSAAEPAGSMPQRERIPGRGKSFD